MELREVEDVDGVARAFSLIFNKTPTHSNQRQINAEINSQIKN